MMLHQTIRQLIQQRHPQQRLLSVLTLCALLFGLGFWAQRKAAAPPDMDYYTAELSRAVRQQQKEVMDLFFNGSFVLNAIQNSANIDSLKQYESKPYTLLIFDQNDSLIYWNNNKASLSRNEGIKVDSFVAQSYRVQNSEYLLIKAPYKPVLNGKPLYYTLAGLIPVYENYNISNEYLKAHFPLLPREWVNHIQVSDSNTPFYVMVEGKPTPLIYLKAKKGSLSKYWAWWAMLFFIGGSILALLALYMVCARLVFGRGLGLMLGLLIAARWLSFAFQFPAAARSFELFSRNFTKLPHWWSNSMGEFILEVGLLLYVAIFVHRELRLAHFRHWSGLHRQYLGFGLYLLIILEAAALVGLISNIVNDSFISFRFDNVSEIEISSFLSVAGITGVFLAILISNYKLLQVFRLFGFGLKKRLTLFALAALLGTLGLSVGGFELFELVNILAFAAILSSALHFFTKTKSVNLLWISLWILFFSGFAAVVFQQSGRQKASDDLNNFARNLADERDNYLEDKFGGLDSLILADEFFSTYFSTGFISRRQTVERLKLRYLDNLFFGRYSYNISLFGADSSGRGGETKDYSEFSFFINKSTKTNHPHLFFYSDPEGRFNYVAKIPISQSDKVQGFIMIEFIPKLISKRTNILVELLKMPRTVQEKITDSYQFALYKKDKKVFSNTDLPPMFLPYNFNVPSLGSFGQAEFNGKKCTMYAHPNGNLSVVLLPEIRFGQHLTVFAYLFCSALLCCGLFIAFLQLWWRLGGGLLLDWRLEISLRERVQRGIVAVSFLSFLAIAGVTLFYFRSEYNSYHQENLSNRVKAAGQIASLQLQTQFDSLSPIQNRSIADIIGKLSEITQLDANLYGLDGQLIHSSSENVFEQKLISKSINPIALHKFNIEGQIQFILNERVADFSYLSAYVIIKDDCDMPVAFINLPYDSEAANTSRAQEVAQFLGALLNVYVLFLLLAGGAALLIARGVTRPLTIIADKLKSVQLNRKNEPLDWKIKDELGTLVKRYNQMLLDLERSKEELELTQRESAWRDMAKQVAHEIKNPLTPMKLGIQFLQKLFYIDPEKAKLKLEKTVQDILLQIDSLSHIASEFSNFAKMPAAQNTQVEMVELCSSVFQLFESEQSETLQLSLNVPDTAVFAFVDKDQILRVLNNLFKNAIQAQPADQPEHVGKVSLQLKTNPDSLTIEIADNGCGIPEEMRKKIFVPNFTTKSSGSGIGLAMCKSIVEAAKGKIYFRDNEPVGTVFVVELPIMSTNP